MPAVSVAQQRFMGMVRAAQKGTLKKPSPSVARAAKSMSTEDAHDFAATKHKGLPAKIKQATFGEKMADFTMDDPGNLAIRHDGTGEDDPSVAMSWDDVMSNDISNHIPDPIARRNFIAALMGLPVDQPQAQPLPAQEMAKAAYVKLNPATREASKPKSPFQTPPHIGQPKAGPIVPPATQDAGKMVMRSAPTVPNPIVPPAQSGDPMPTQKVAGACTVPASMNRYTSAGKKGKKTMPQPHARRLKQAAGPMTPSRFGAAMAAAHAIETVREKQALGGIGTAIGAVGGLTQSPSGHRMEGVGRGVGQGLGWDIGGGLGATAGMGLGALGGAAAGPAIAQLIAALQGRQADPNAMAQAAITGGTAGAGLGGLGGYFGGGMLGRGAAKGMMGDPTWEEDNSARQTTAAQMAAP